MFFKMYNNVHIILAKLHCVCSPNTCCEINNDVLLHSISAFFSQQSLKQAQLKSPSYSLVFPLNQGDNVHIKENCCYGKMLGLTL